MTRVSTWGRSTLIALLALTGCEVPGPRVTMIPVPSLETRAAAAGWGTGTWLDQHEDINRIGDSRPIDVVFLGDSITQSWGGEGRAVGAPANGVWRRSFGDLAAANFGISGDRTQHVLWRIENGNFDGITPKVVVLLIGTNNLEHDSAIDIASGIESIVDRLTTDFVSMKLLVCSVVRGRTLQNPLRRKAIRVNELLVEALAEDSGVEFVDLERVFYFADGRADTRLWRRDFVHFSEAGYRAWADAVSGRIRRALRAESEVAESANR